MGVYTEYGSVQIKIDKDRIKNPLHLYKIGDNTVLDDGIYLGWNGAIVIKDHIFIAEFPYIKDQADRKISIEDILFNAKRI